MSLAYLRLELRPFSSSDLLALIEGPEAFQRSFGRPAADGLRSLFVSGEISDKWFEQLRQTSQRDPWTIGFAVVERASGLAIGSAGFKGPPDTAGVVEAAYGIVPAFEGRGFATEALRELVAFASRDDRVRAIRAHTLPAENASTRVLLKNGFSKLGEVVDPEDGRVWRWERSKLTPGTEGCP